MGPLSLGTKTPYGKIEAVGARDGERYYMCLKDGVVSLIPGPALEAGMHFCQKIDDELVEKYNREVGDAK